MSLLSQAPPVHDIKDPGVVNPEKISGAAVPVFVFKDFNTRLCAVDLVFEAGYKHSSSPIIPGAAGQLLLTATSTKNAEIIANEFDLYGAYTQCSVENDHSKVSLFCLDKFLPQVLGLFVANFNDQVFDEKELEYYKLRKSQSLRLAAQKTSYLAKKALNEHLFGPDHYMGQASTPELAEALTAEECRLFFKEYFKLKYIVLTGPVTDELLKMVVSSTTSLPVIDGENKIVLPQVRSSELKYLELPKEDAVQCSLSMGMKSIGFLHPDYIRLQITNVLFGGFFGSRLMKNIREDKGYTYGISSSLFTFDDASVLSIGADLKKTSYHEAVKEIFKEAERLKSEQIPAEELSVLKSYLQGSIVHRMDNSTALAGMFISLFERGSDMNYYLEYFKTLGNIDSGEINQIAATYLHTDSFYTVVAGI